MTTLHKSALLCAVSLFISTLVMAGATGATGPGTAATSGSTSYNWTDEANGLTDNSSSAMATIVGKNSLSNTLRYTNFGFAIPGGSTIDGIDVEIRMQGAKGKTLDSKIQLRKTSGLVGNNKARKNARWPRKAAKFVSFGSSTDKWGTTWTPAEINSSDFGIDIVAKCKKQFTNSRVEYIKITVYYDQSNYYSKSAGNLNLTTSWGVNTDGSGANPSNFTADGQIFNLRNRATPTLAANLTISGVGSKLVVGDGSTAINFTIPATFTYTGELDLANNGTLMLNNTTIPTLGKIANGASTSYVIFGSNGNQSVPGKSYYRLTISGTGTKTLTGICNTEENFVIAAGATFDDGSYYLFVDGDLTNSGTHSSTITGGGIFADGFATQVINGTNGIFGNLFILNDLDVSLNTNITVNGQLKLAEGNLQLGTYTLTLNGTTTYELGALYGISTSKLTINGSAATDSIEFAAGGRTVGNLTVNKPASTTALFVTELIVATTLTLTQGIIDNESNVFTLGTSTANRGTLTYTAGKVAGPMTRWFTTGTNSGSTGHFPVGTALRYAPVVVSYTTAPTTGGRITAQFIATSPGNAGLPLAESGRTLDQSGATGYWNLGINAIVGGAYTGSFTATNFGGITDYSTLHLLRRTNGGSNWELHGTHQATTGSNAIPVLSRTGMTGYGHFGVGGESSINPLPVVLTIFESDMDEADVRLNWSTASEINSDLFEVWYANNLEDWAVIMEMPAMGNSSTTSHYQTLVPINTSAAIHYFKLRMVDLDGANEWSSTLVETSNDNPVLNQKTVKSMPALFMNGKLQSKLERFDDEDLYQYEIVNSKGQTVSKFILAPGEEFPTLPNPGTANGGFVVRATPL